MHIKPSGEIGMASKWSEKYRWHDGKRVLKWKGQASHYNSGQKRKHPPLNEESAKFGFEVRRERVRQFKSQKQLGKELGFSEKFVRKVEMGLIVSNFRNRLMYERLRIWVETHKPPCWREKFDNVDSMFKEK